MIRILLRAFSRRAYSRGMRTHPRMEPERRLDVLDGWTGMWVAVKDGEVVAAAYNSRDLVPQVRKLGERGHGAVAQYVPPRTEDIIIGVG